MTIDGFNEKISETAMARMGLQGYCGYPRHDAREDKYLLPILACSVPPPKRAESRDPSEPGRKFGM